MKVRTGDGDDAISLALSNPFPADVVVVGDDASSTDRITVVGTGGPDAINLGLFRLPGNIDDTSPDPEDGAKAVRLSHATGTIDIVGYEAMTLDVASGGADTITVDRQISGLDRPLELTVLGGGGDDTLEVTSRGNVSQKVAIDNGTLTIGDNPGGSEVFLGRSDNVAIDQPRVVMEVIDFQPTGAPPLFINNTDSAPGFATVGAWSSVPGSLGDQIISAGGRFPRGHLDVPHHSGA